MAEIILSVPRFEIRGVRIGWKFVTQYYEISWNGIECWEKKKKEKNQFKFGRTIREISQKSTTPSKVILPVHAPIAEQRSAAIYNETFYISYHNHSKLILALIMLSFVSKRIRDFADELSQFSSYFHFVIISPSDCRLFLNYPFKAYNHKFIFLRLKFVQIRRIFEGVIIIITLEIKVKK